MYLLLPLGIVYKQLVAIFSTMGYFHSSTRDTKNAEMLGTLNRIVSSGLN